MASKAARKTPHISSSLTLMINHFKKAHSLIALKNKLKNLRATKYFIICLMILSLL